MSRPKHAVRVVIMAPPFLDNAALFRKFTESSLRLRDEGEFDYLRLSADDPPEFSRSLAFTPYRLTESSTADEPGPTFELFLKYLCQRNHDWTPDRRILIGPADGGFLDLVEITAGNIEWFINALSDPEFPPTVPWKEWLQRAVVEAESTFKGKLIHIKRLSGID